METDERTYSRVARRITIALFATQSLVSAAFVVGGTISVLVVAQLSGGPTWAGLATCVTQIGTALAALVVAAISDRTGRRWGLALGLAVGVLGGGLAAGAILMNSLMLFLIASVLLGVAMAAGRLSRFAAAEVQAPERRGRAISLVVLGGAVGAVAGPLLVGPSGRWAARMGSVELVGPFVTGAVILAVAALVIVIWLRPDPRDVGREVAERYPETIAHQGPARSAAQILRTPAAAVALSAMAVAQVAMAMVTGMASLDMRGHQHSLADIALVMSAHTLGMFAFSIVAGRVADRWGRGPVIVIGALMLAISCALAPVLSGVLAISIDLFLLGVGWNFCYVGGSALLSDQLAPAEQARTQGANDLLVGLTTAVASLGSGMLFAAAGYGTVAFVAAGASLVPAALAGWWLVRSRRLARGLALTGTGACVDGSQAFTRFAPQPACRV